jgi:hypothetical protein
MQGLIPYNADAVPLGPIKGDVKRKYSRNGSIQGSFLASSPTDWTGLRSLFALSVRVVLFRTAVLIRLVDCANGGILHHCGSI